jgi:hypothetical protein
MKTINNYWVDENNNRWSKTLYTQTQAEEESKTLTNCSDCSGCSDCSDCSDCSNCSGCSNCYNCSGCSGCSNCSNCSGCSDCYNCSYCFDCSDFKSNPQKYTTSDIGSRNKQTTFYWDANKILVVCGCFSATLDKFKNQVIEKHKDNKYAKQYLKEIKNVEYLIKNL